MRDRAGDVSALDEGNFPMQMDRCTPCIGSVNAIIADVRVEEEPIKVNDNSQ
ncbi:MAG: hypothetical protein ACK5EA_00790 [Planctomycetaceae bacterium]